MSPVAITSQMAFYRIKITVKVTKILSLTVQKVKAKFKVLFDTKKFISGA